MNNEKVWGLIRPYDLRRPQGSVNYGFIKGGEIWH